MCSLCVHVELFFTRFSMKKDTDFTELIKTYKKMHKFCWQ